MMDIIKARMARASVFAFAAAAAGAAMADVVCYEYLTISGSSISDGVNLLTDYVPKSNTVVRARYASSSAATSGANQLLFCSRLKASATADALNFNFAPNVSGKFRFDYYDKQNAATSSFTANRDYELEVRDGKAYVTDTTTSSVVATLGNGLQSFTPQYKLALFQSYTYSNGSYTLGSNSFHGKFYYLAIYDIENGEEVLKHYFVPCLDGGVVKLCDVADSYATSALTITGGGSAAVGGKERETIGADSYVVAENGTITLDTPSIYAQLVNAAAECIFDQTGDSASMENAHSFTGFTSYVGAGTFFRGGWWDFGAGNLGSAADSASNHHAEFSDGAFVTNVANVHVAGTSGTNNQLRLTGASSFFAGYLSLGSSTSAGQKSKVTVGDGSLLHVSGELSLSTGEKWRGAREQTGNSLTVSGEGSRLVVGGQTSLGRNRDNSDSQYMRFGGNTFTVTDGATATLGALNVDTGGAYGGESNRVVFSGNARVTMTSLSFATAGQYGGRGGNLLEIIDGAVVTNTGTMMFGMQDIRKELGNRIVVSNATFNTALKNHASRGYFLVWGHGNTFVMSGADAKLTVRDTIHGYFLGNDSMFIMENNASRNTVSSFYTYTGAASGNTVLVRTGATMNCPNGITTIGQANVGQTASARNKLVVESGGAINTESAKDINIYGKGAMLTVDDGSINCGGEVRIGSTDHYNTNCLAKVCGTHPKMTIAKSLDVKNGSCLRFELPATGYDANAATGENPLLVVGATAGNGIYIDETSRLEFTGAEAMQAYLVEANEGRKYVLVKANSGGINLPDGQLEALRAQLPEGMALDIVPSGSGQSLVLRAGSRRGMYLIFK